MSSSNSHQPNLQTVSDIGITAIPDKSIANATISVDAPEPPEVKPWERPGFSGTSRRYLRAVQRYVWDDPDKPKEEKWFLFKLDVFLLTSACLGYFSRNLDAANVNSAYISGMKESLQMYGSELTYAHNVFTAGYVIGQIPAVMLATRVRPSLLIPTLEVLWSVLTFCSAAIQNVSQLYAIRFLVGFCESAYFPVMIYLVSSWYVREERGKRLVIFYSTAAMALMFSGYIQAGAYNGLNGRLGHSGWQWLFIICGVISLPIAFLGYFFIPDFPETTRAFYLTDKERQWARERLVLQGLKPLGASEWERTKILRIVKQWQFWVLPLGYFILQASTPIYQPAYAIWLRSTGHTVYEANVWPTGQIAVALVVQWLAGMVSDSPLLRGRRWQALIAMQLPTIFASIVLAVWDVPLRLKYVAFYLSYFCVGTPGIFYAWFVELIPHDHEMRGFVIAVSNTFSHINSIWFTIAVWRTKDAPKYTPGFTAASVIGGIFLFYVLLIRILERRDDSKRQIESHGANDVETPVDSSPSSEKGASEADRNSEEAAVPQSK